MIDNRIPWTPAQRDAVLARGGSLLVSAAAGSGKTRVLVERAVQLITDPQTPVDADRLLIMTFTNAAGAKLRADITARLEEEVRRTPADRRLRRQQMLLQRATIGTVDSFCLHFVREHFTALDVPPDFDTGEEAALFRIRQETLAAVLEQAYQDADFCAFADLFDRGRTDNTAGETVLSLYDFVRTMPNVHRALAEFCAMWEQDAPPEKTPWGKTLLELALSRVAAARCLLAAAQRAAATDADAEAAFGAALQLAELSVQKAQNEVAAGRWEAARQALADCRPWPAAGRMKGGRAANPAASEAAELYTMAKKRVETVCGDLLLCSAAEFAQDRARALPLIRALARTAEQFGEAYFAAKREEKLLDYSDYEHLTLTLLQTPDGCRTELCEKVSRRVACVMVDEYQDTNALQNAIYYSMADAQASNLFFVGDIKQSIYRFRQADPEVFLDCMNRCQPYQDGGGSGQQWPASIALDANFRSAPAVVAGVNFLFEQIFSAQLGGVDYGQGQRLVAGAETNGYAGLCELSVVAGADTAADAERVAARVAEMQAQGFAVRDHGAQRPCRWEDFCILLRSRAAFETYEQALKSRGIPVFADVAGDLLDAAHVRPFAALLRILNNPAQDVPLAAVMLSPLTAFTPDDLVRLRAATPKGSLYGAVLHSEEPACRAFCGWLDGLRRLTRTCTVSQLMEELLARTGYLAAVGAMPDGARCRDELGDFAAWAGAAGRAGLPALVRAMDAVERGGRKLPIGQTGSGQTRPGCVSIMTVHRAKGLEFPIVFVADTAHQFNRSDSIRPVLYHRLLGVGLTLRAENRAVRYRTLAHAALGKKTDQESLSEEMRVLYVALTRAQDALIITVPLKRGWNELKTPALQVRAGLTGPETLQSSISWAGWLLTAALRHPASGVLWSHTGQAPRTIETTAPLILRVEEAQPPEDTLTQPSEAETPISELLSAANQPQEGSKQRQAAVPQMPTDLLKADTAPPDADLQAALAENFAWHSPEEALREIPAKVSVSAVVHAQEETRPERPAFLQQSGLTGAERGTALHTFLHNLPLELSTDDTLCLEKEIARQQHEHLLDPVLAACLNRDALRAFLQSAAWRRVRHAEQVLREEPFITSLPAGEIDPAVAGRPGAEAGVLVQGIADVVLVFDAHAEILDYKTDHSREPSFYIEEYGGQLRLYRRAFAGRLRVPVTKLTIYSFALGQEIDLPLEGPLRAKP